MKDGDRFREFVFFVDEPGGPRKGHKLFQFVVLFEESLIYFQAQLNSNFRAKVKVDNL